MARRALLGDLGIDFRESAAAAVSGFFLKTN